MVRDFIEDTWPVLTALAVIAAIVTTLILVFGGGPDCPKGQHEIITGWTTIVMSTGKTTFIDEVPITECVK